MKLRRWALGKATAGALLLIAAMAAIALLGITRLDPDESEAFLLPFEPGEAIHTVIEYRMADLRTGEVDLKTEETWTLVGDDRSVSKLRVFLRDAIGNLLQDGFIDAPASRVGTHFSPGQPLGGVTLTHQQLQPASVIMWDPRTIQKELLDTGFVTKGETLVAGRQAAAYERALPFVFNGGAPEEAISIEDFPYLKQFVGTTEIVSRVFVGTTPLGIDMGEETFYRDSQGTQYASYSRRVVLFEVLDGIDVPIEIFDWPHAR